MKKIIVVLLLLLLVGVGAVYYFIPSKLTVAKTAFINTSSRSLLRCTESVAYWQKWAGQGTDKLKVTDTSIIVNNYEYIVKSNLFGENGVVIKNGNELYKTAIIISPASHDSSIFIWNTVVSTGNNPFSKIVAWQKAVSLKKQMDVLTARLKNFAEKTINIYGFEVQNIKVTDTLLLSTKLVSKGYPSTAAIYNAVSKLQKTIQQKGAAATNSPMLNVTTLDSITYNVQVAVPINKIIEVKQPLVLKYMVMGSILVAAVKGGPCTVRKATQSLQYFVDDNAMVSPAIPFELLVTDRSKETDTSKWITKIYYPVM
jgi:hypothetical protein